MTVAVKVTGWPTTAGFGEAVTVVVVVMVAAAATPAVMTMPPATVLMTIKVAQAPLTTDPSMRFFTTPPTGLRHSCQ